MEEFLALILIGLIERFGLRLLAGLGWDLTSRPAA